MMKQLLIAGLGGGIGSMARFALYHLIKFNQFPLATLLINIVGSLLIGIVIGFSLKEPQWNLHWKIFLATGICGGFTTFSAFSADNLELIQQGKTGIAAGYILGSVALGIFATWIGIKIIS